ncbi:MAG: GntR family transcriptional regulator [Lachnospiraceae bacterium]|nr:GntR family transcriptional regulator [Lachnospiraceae bacterium]
MFQVDAMSRIPVYEQIVEQMERFILAGIMNPNDKLPSVRNLSVELAINPNTIQKSYTELDRRGVIYSVPGRGSFVAADALERIGGNKRMKLNELKELMNELKLAGITFEEVEECLKRVYSETEDGENAEEGGDLK